TVVPVDLNLAMRQRDAMGSQSRRRSSVLIIISLLMLMLGCSHNERRAKDRPDTRDITDALSIRVPNYFSIDDVKIEGQANDINPGQLFGGFSFSDWSIVIGREPDEVFMKTVFSFT